DEDLDWQAVLADRSHFLDVHLERGFARDTDDKAVRFGDLRAYRGGEAVAHRAEPAAGQPAVGRRKAEMLRRPHLVLANLGGDDGIAPPRCLEERFNRALRHDFSGPVLLFGKVQTASRTPAVDAAPPFAKIAR